MFSEVIPKRVAVWIFDKGIRERDWFSVFQSSSDTFQAQAILTEDLEKIVPSVAGEEGLSLLKLSSTSRTLITLSKYDPQRSGWPRQGRGGHLTFLDSKSTEVRIYRGLHLDESGCFSWDITRSVPLEEARIDSETGEIIADADVTAAAATHSEVRPPLQERVGTIRDNGMTSPDHDSMIKGPQPQAPSCAPIETGGQMQHPEEIADVQATEFQNDAPPVRPYEAVETDPWALFRDKLLSCQRCGAKTKDWVSASRSTGTCICKKCYGQTS